MTRARHQLSALSWADAVAGRVVRRIDPGELRRLLVVAAHPDDESLAAAGLMQAVHAGGGRVELVVATDGEAAFPGLDRAARAELGRTRRAELHRALRVHGMAAVAVHWLGLPDSGLGEQGRAEELAELLRPHLRDVEAYLAPWTGDPHPDHAVAGAAAAAAAPVSAHGWNYPIWMWTRTGPEDPAIPWSHAAYYVLSQQQRDRKRRALTCFTSQLEAAPGGGPPILPARVLRHFEGHRELYFRVPRRDSAPARRFEQLYTSHGDPWQTRTSWYERRKRTVTAACLSRARYRHAAEPGCGLGELTRELARRCDRVDASDYAEAAVAAARAATAGLAGVSVTHRELADPAVFPDGIDLAVLSEVLYYLSPADVAAVVHRLADALVPGGEVLLAHWRGWPAEAPRDAAATHATLLADPRFEMLLEHTDAEFLLHVARLR